jgi:hypothetical protein
LAIRAKSTQIPVPKIIGGVVNSLEEGHAATVWQIVVGDVSRIVGIPHGSQCSSSDANRSNSDDGRRAHVMHQTVVTLVSAHFHENKIETSIGT